MKFGCYDAYIENNTVFFSAIDHNGLYKMRLDSNEMTKIAEFQYEKNISELHRKVIIHDRVLFFVPYKGSGISSYHLDTNKMDYVIPSYGGEIHASDAILVDDTIWVIPRELSQPLYELNIKRCMLYKHEEWNNKLHKIIGITRKHILSFTSTCIVGKAMLTVIYNTPYIIKTELTTGDIELFHISENVGLRGITADNNGYWLTLAKGGSILYVDFISNKIEHIKLDLSKDATFMNIIVSEEFIIILPCKNTKIFKLYKKQQTAFVIEDRIDHNKVNRNLPLYMGWLKDEQGLIFLPCVGGDIVRCSAENESKIEFISENVKRQGIIFHETNDNSLFSFIGTVKLLNGAYKQEVNVDDETYGEIIWDST